MKGNVAALVAGALAAGVMPPALEKTHRYYGRAAGSRAALRVTMEERRAYKRGRRVRNRAARHARRVQRMRSGS